MVHASSRSLRDSGDCRRLNERLGGQLILLAGRLLSKRRGLLGATCERDSEGTLRRRLATLLKPVRFSMSLDDDRNWAAKIYQERADTIDADRNVTYFFLKDYQEICRYMRTIGYGSKGKAESVEKQVARELEIGRYCSLRTTVRGRQSTQDIALFIYQDPAANLSGSGLVVVSFDTGGELAKQFADAWFEKTDASLRKGFTNIENS